MVSNNGVLGKPKRAAKRQQVKEVNAKGKFVQKDDEKDSATSAKKGYDLGGDIRLTSPPFSLKKDGVYLHAKPAENGRSPSSQKDYCHQNSRRYAIPAAVRHELVRHARGQCMYLAPDGSRCEARGMLEIDHRVPHSLRISDDISNLRVLCREHNMGTAIEVFGKGFKAEYVMARFR